MNSWHDGTVVANQTVNPGQTQIIDDFYDEGKGVSVLHEVLEAYVGAKDSPGTGVPQFGEASSPNFKNYKAAHDQAQVLDPRHVEPIITQDQVSGQLYINKPHPVLPGLNIEKLVNDLSKKNKK